MFTKVFLKKFGMDSIIWFLRHKIISNFAFFSVKCNNKVKKKRSKNPITNPKTKIKLENKLSIKVVVINN